MIPDFAMFSAAGNKAVAAVVDAVLSLPITSSDKHIYELLTNRMNLVAQKHPEVWDTDVREAIIDTLEQKLNRDLTIYF